MFINEKLAGFYKSFQSLKYYFTAGMRLYVLNPNRSKDDKIHLILKDNLKPIYVYKIQNVYNYSII